MSKVVYECELCGNPFDSEKEAEKCEQSHYATCANQSVGLCLFRFLRLR
jgi:hypothetical protein